MLEARGLAKQYGSQIALHPLDLTIAAGEVFCLLGANGAGKTTTINLFLDFIAPTAGSALIGGVEVASNPLATKQQLAYIPEQVTLYRNLSGLENLRFFAALATGDKLPDSRLLEILKAAGLPDGAAGKRVGGYSKGMRQKVGIAIAMAKNARALLLDEPTSGLDPKASNEFSALLTRLSGEGVAILMATHDLFRAKESGTRIGIMREGRMRQQIATSDIGHADLEQLYLEQMRD